MMRGLLATVVAFAPLAALAQDVSIDQTKVYTTVREHCSATGQESEEAQTLRFDQGIEAYEYHCDFFEVKQAEGSPFLLVEAVCEVPGARNPDLLSISPYQDDSIEVTSLYDSTYFEPTDENPNPGVTIYYRCD
jgi:hypothetical protein